MAKGRPAKATAPKPVGRKTAPPHLIPNVPHNYTEPITDDDDDDDNSSMSEDEAPPTTTTLALPAALPMTTTTTATLTLGMFAAAKTTSDLVKMLGTTTGMVTAPAATHDTFYQAADAQVVTEEKALAEAQAKKVKDNTFGVKGFALVLDMVTKFAATFQTKPGEFAKTMRFAPRCLPIKVDEERLSGSNLRSTAKITQEIYEFELAIDTTADFSRSTIAQVYVVNNTMDGFETANKKPVVKNGWVEFLPSVAAVRHARFTRVVYFLTPVFKYTAGKTTTPMMLLPPPLAALRNEMFSSVDMPTVLHDAALPNSVKNDALLMWQEGDYGPAKQFTSLLKIYTTYCSQLTLDDDEESKLFANLKKLHMVAVPCVGRVVDMQAAYLELLMGQADMARLHNKKWEKTMPLEMLAAGAFMMITVNTAIKTSELPTVSSVVEVDAEGAVLGGFAEFDPNEDVEALSNEDANEIARTHAIAKRVVTGDYPLFDNMNKRGASTLYVEQLAAAIADNGLVAQKVLASQGFALTAIGYKLRNMESMMQNLADRLTPGSDEHAALMDCMDRRDGMTTGELMTNQDKVRAAATMVQDKLLKDQVALQQQIDELARQNHIVNLQKKHTECEVDKQKTSLLEATTELDLTKRLLEKAEADAAKWRLLNTVINECGGAALQGGYQCARFAGVNATFMEFIKSICQSMDVAEDFNEAVGDVLINAFPTMVMSLLQVKGLDTMFVDQLDDVPMTEAECLMQLCVNPADALEHVWQTGMEKNSLRPDQRSKYLTAFCKDKLHLADSVVNTLVKSPRTEGLDYLGSEPNKRPQVKRKSDDTPSSPSKRARK